MARSRKHPKRITQQSTLAMIRRVMPPARRIIQSDADKARCKRVKRVDVPPADVTD